MRKTVASILAGILMLLIMCPAVMAGSVYKVTLSVYFVPNLIFSRYDVDIYFDNEKMENLSHGEDYSGTFYAEEGANTLYFYKKDDKSVNGTIKFNVNSDTTISCKLYCYNNRIDLDNVTIEEDNPATQAPVVAETSTPEPVITEAPTLEPTKEPVITETPSPEPVITEAPTPEPEPIVTETPTPRPVAFSDIDLHSMSDEDLAVAVAAIKEEQRSRIKTRIILDKTAVSLPMGKTDKLSGSIEELPDGENAPKLEWSTSDKTVVSVNNGQIKAVAGGNAVITCSTTLSDGTYIYTECAVKVIVPVASVTTDKKTIQLSAGDSFTPKYVVKPDNATEPTLSFESSDPAVASVNNRGGIKGYSAGKATITAKTTDGSEKAATITVTVTYDSYMKDMKGKDLYDRVISGERTSTNVEGGDNEWYDRGTYIGGISFEVHSKGKNGQLVGVEVLDL